MLRRTRILSALYVIVSVYAAAGKGYPLKTNSMNGIMQIRIPKINVYAGVLRGVGDELAQLR